jgi:hypothetical protein
MALASIWNYFPMLGKIEKEILKDGTEHTGGI